MGSFEGHVVPGTLFLVVGVWHIWSSLMRYTSNPKSFQVRAWSPVPGFDGKFKYLELYIVAIGSFIDLCIELLYSPHLKFFVHGILNPTHMNNFEHSGMLLMFFIFGGVALISEKTRFLPLPQEVLCLIAAVAFCSEYLLFYFHSTAHKGLEGYYHLILVILIGICILAAIAGALFRTNFAVDLSSGIAITLQGLWFYQTAFTLYGPMIPDGCLIKDNEISCHSSDSAVRGELLANFQLFGLVFGVLASVVVAHGYAASRFGHSDLKSLYMVQDGVDQY